MKPQNISQVPDSSTPVVGSGSVWQKFVFWLRRVKQHRWLIWLDLPIFIVLVLGITLFTFKQAQAPIFNDLPPQNAKQFDPQATNGEGQPGEKTTAPADQPAAAPPATAPSGGSGGSTGQVAGCATPTQHVPDGPDGMGGCWPGASNTGVPGSVSLSTYTGPCTITTAGTVIDAKTINCELLIRANNVLVKRSHLKGGIHGLEANGASFTVEDSFIDNGICDNCSVDGWNFTLRRNELTGSNRAAYCMNHCTVEDNWIHGTALDPNSQWHASAMRAEQYAYIRHNVLACDWTGPFNNDEIGCSADMSGYPDFSPIQHNTIDGNLFRANPVGLGFCAYGGGTNGKPYSNDPANATYIIFKNNVFERGSNGKCGTWGAITDFISGRTGNEWFNNKWSDGLAVDPE